MRKNTPEYVKELSKEFRKNQTEAENKLWLRLRGNNLNGYKFKRQYSIGRYVADFYCSIARLVIEIDGEIHENPEQKDYDLLRECELKASDIKVLRFSNEQVLMDIEDVLKEINYTIVKIKCTENA